MKTTRLWVFLIAYASAVGFFSAPASWGIAPEDAASAIYGVTGGNYDSTGSFENNVSKPITSSNTPMSTLDGSKSFNAQLTCPSTSSFLEVSVTASATGDLNATISQDTNFDGILDYTYSPPFNLSGVCSNGVISCDPGTWLNCKYYKWLADSGGRAGLQEVYITNLGGCYCINNDCGNNLAWNSLSLLLKDLGGGVVGAVQAVNPRYAITDVKVNGSLLTYYGQDSVNCTSITSNYGSSSPEQYYTDPGAMSADTEAEVLTQSQDPASYYSLATTTASRNPTQQRDCTINRTVTYTGGKVYSLQFNARLDNDCGLGSGNSFAVYTNLGAVSPNGSGYSTIDIASTSPDIRVTSADLTGYGNIFTGDYAVTEPWYRLWDWNCDNGNYLEVRLLPGYACGSAYDTFTELTDDQCSGLENDSLCKLQDEVVDGVYAYQNFNPTGLSPLSSCKTFVDGACSADVCRDWWEKKRTYLCETGTTFDFSDVLKRAETVVSTTTDNVTTLYYQDMKKDGAGNWIYEANTVALSPRGSYDDCTKACKTRMSKTDTQAGTTGHTGQTRTTTLSYDFFYKKCSDSTCPLETGEEMVKDCQCMDDFAEAASVMLSLEEASKYLICSSGVKQ